MELNADFTQRIVMHAEELEWTIAVTTDAEVDADSVVRRIGVARHRS